MQQGCNVGGGQVPCVREGGSTPIPSSQGVSSHQTSQLLRESIGSRGVAWPLTVSVAGPRLVSVSETETVEWEPGIKINRLFLTLDLSCSSMLISQSLFKFFFVSQSLFQCPGMQSSPGSLLLPSSSIPQATSLSSRPSTGMRPLWASTLTTAQTSCPLSSWAPTPLPPISSLQVNQFLPGLLSLSRYGSAALPCLGACRLSRR